MRRALILALIVIGLLLPASAAAHNPHKVKRGETLSGIAARHNTSVRRLMHLNPRRLDNPNEIRAGQKLRTHGNRNGNGNGRPQRVRCHRVWPVPGRTVYTYPGHDGVDVNRGSGWDDYGDPIRAAACGTITYVGWNRGYGDAIFQRVRSGREVVYGHTSSQNVYVGERVRAGELIGRVGSTGNSSAPHLHFGFPGGSYAQALDFLLGGGAGGAGQFLHRETLDSLTVRDIAALDGTGILTALPNAPRTEPPWSVRWRQVAMCESSRRWHINTGNGYYGGLQFLDATWDAYRNGEFAHRADLARVRAQKTVAERVLHGPQGIGAWPTCGVLGL